MLQILHKYAPLKASAAVLMCAISTLTLSACVSQQQRDAEMARLTLLRTKLHEAEQHTSYTCPDKRSCERAFSKAKLFVHQYSMMKIHSSDEVAIETFNPIEYGYVGMRILKTPGAGDSSTISIAARCKGYEPWSSAGYFYEACMERLTTIYTEFPKFIAD